MNKSDGITYYLNKSFTTKYIFNHEFELKTLL